MLLTLAPFLLYLMREKHYLLLKDHLSLPFHFLLGPDVCFTVIYFLWFCFICFLAWEIQLLNFKCEKNIHFFKKNIFYFPKQGNSTEKVINYWPGFQNSGFNLLHVSLTFCISSSIKYTKSLVFLYSTRITCFLT